jgi:hypothetical protein
MGYKRMKKRKDRAACKKWLKEQMRVAKGISSLLFANWKVYERGNVDGRMKWFESPNAEGYLKL